MAGILFFSLYVVVQTGAHIVKNTRVIALTTILAAAVNVGLNVILIPALGILGASYATALSYLVAFVALYVLAQRLSHVPYEIGKVLVTQVAAVGLVALGPVVSSGRLWPDVPLKLALLVAYTAVLLVARVVTRDELRLLAGELARRLRVGSPRVFGRIHENHLLLDLRSVLPGDDERIAAALQQPLLKNF